MDVYTLYTTIEPHKGDDGTKQKKKYISVHTNRHAQPSSKNMHEICVYATGVHGLAE
jgi:hypothetical protein